MYIEIEKNSHMNELSPKIFVYTVLNERKKELEEHTETNLGSKSLL